MGRDPEGPRELVQVPVGQLAMEDPVELAEGAGSEEIGRGREGLPDLQIRLPIQIGSLDVAEGVRLTMMGKPNRNKLGVMILPSPGGYLGDDTLTRVGGGQLERRRPLSPGRCRPH